MLFRVLHHTVQLGCIIAAGVAARTTSATTRSFSRIEIRNSKTTLADARLSHRLFSSSTNTTQSNALEIRTSAVSTSPTTPTRQAYASLINALSSPVFMQMHPSGSYSAISQQFGACVGGRSGVAIQMIHGSLPKPGIAPSGFTVPLCATGSTTDTLFRNAWSDQDSQSGAFYVLYMGSSGSFVTSIGANADQTSTQSISPQVVNPVSLGIVRPQQHQLDTQKPYIVILSSSTGVWMASIEDTGLNASYSYTRIYTFDSQHIPAEMATSGSFIYVIGSLLHPEDNNGASYFALQIDMARNTNTSVALDVSLDMSLLGWLNMDGGAVRLYRKPAIVCGSAVYFAFTMIQGTGLLLVVYRQSDFTLVGRSGVLIPSKDRVLSITCFSNQSQGSHWVDFEGIVIMAAPDDPKLSAYILLVDMSANASSKLDVPRSNLMESLIPLNATQTLALAVSSRASTLGFLDVSTGSSIKWYFSITSSDYLDSVTFSSFSCTPDSYLSPDDNGCIACSSIANKEMRPMSCDPDVSTNGTGGTTDPSNHHVDDGTLFAKWFNGLSDMAKSGVILAFIVAGLTVITSVCLACVYRSRRKRTSVVSAVKPVEARSAPVMTKSLTTLASEEASALETARFNLTNSLEIEPASPYDQYHALLGHVSTDYSCRQVVSDQSDADHCLATRTAQSQSDGMTSKDKVPKSTAQTQSWDPDTNKRSSGNHGHDPRSETRPIDPTTSGTDALHKRLTESLSALPRRRTTLTFGQSNSDISFGPEDESSESYTKYLWMATPSGSHSTPAETDSPAMKITSLPVSLITTPSGSDMIRQSTRSMTQPEQSSDKTHEREDSNRDRTNLFETVVDITPSILDESQDSFASKIAEKGTDATNTPEMRCKMQVDSGPITGSWNANDVQIILAPGQFLGLVGMEDVVHTVDPDAGRQDQKV